MINPASTPRRKRTNRFGQFVLKRRNELGLTQREIADALGLEAKEFVGLIEKGQRRPNYERLPKLAQILNTSVVTLFQLIIWDTYPYLAEVIFSKKAQPVNVVKFKAESSVTKKLNALPLDSRQIIVRMIDSLYAEHIGNRKN